MKLLNALSGVYVLFVFAFVLGVGLSSSGGEYRVSGSAAGRNENSTPRTFVLPATPAVAGEQERLQRLLENEPQRKRCMLALFDRGYSIGNIEAIDNIQVVVSIIRFQRESGLTVTGDLDMATTQSLGCPNAS